MWLSVFVLIGISAFLPSPAFKSIAYTNVFQMLLLIVVFADPDHCRRGKAGGPMAIYEHTPASYWNLFLPANDPNYPWLAIILGYRYGCLVFGVPTSRWYNRVLGAKNLRQGQMGANFTGWLKILDVALFIHPGHHLLCAFP
jgi:SSS family solute:Na+ symporter